MLTPRLLSNALPLVVLFIPAILRAQPVALFEKHCFECHDSTIKQGGLDLSALKVDLGNLDNFARWIKIYDRIESGEMPPKKKARPPLEERAAATKWIKESLVKAERERLGKEVRTGLRRMTRVEYENTIRDLFDLPGIALQSDLPADGSVHGFDKNSDALDISHVNLTKYIEAADHVLDMAIATQAQAPKSVNQRISLASQYIVRIILMNGDAVLLKDKKPDPKFPPPGERGHLDLGAHGRAGVFSETSSVGVFRHEDE